MSPTANFNDDNRGNNGLYMAFELGSTSWTLVSFARGKGRKPRRRRLAAGNLLAVQEEIRLAKDRFGLDPSAPVFSVYEAGRDGFWLDRWLRSQGVENIVVDSASIEVNRRARRTKTDRLDALKLLSMLMRYLGGESDLWSVVEVPDAEVEDLRRISREVTELTKERSEHITRIKSLLALWGMKLKSAAVKSIDFSLLRSPCGGELPAHARRELEREWTRLTLVRQQIKEIEEEQKALLEESEDPMIEKIRRLEQLKGIGSRSSWLLVLEFFGWRKFRNRRQVGSLAGMTGSPYDSDKSEREQGISKAGSKRVRSMICEIAWGWLRYQPKSKVTRWFETNYGPGTKRMRRVGIVGVGRRLLIALWRYLDFDLVPEGAVVLRSA